MLPDFLQQNHMRNWIEPDPDAIFFYWNSTDGVQKHFIMLLKPQSYA